MGKSSRHTGLRRRPALAVRSEERLGMVLDYQCMGTAATAWQSNRLGRGRSRTAKRGRHRVSQQEAQVEIREAQRSRAALLVLVARIAGITNCQQPASSADHPWVVLLLAHLPGDQSRQKRQLAQMWYCHLVC